MSDTLPQDNIPPQALAQLLDTAADWFVRRQQPSWTSDDEHRLNAWLAQKPMHREVFEGMGRNWHSGPQLKALFPDDFSTTDAGRPAMQPKPPLRWLTWLMRRPTPALAVLVLALAAGGWYRWDNTASYTVQVATALGEMRDINLPDGSLMALNVGSRALVRYYPRRREIVLEEGEAFFRVTADANRPFTVDVGTSQVKVVGTAFNVRATPPRLVLKVREGRVQLIADRRRPQAGTLLLGGGSGVSLDMLSGERRSVPAEASTVGDWRSGQVQFSQAPLNEVVMELSRYLGRPVTLADPALEQLRVSGLLATQSPERFLRALPALLPVRILPPSNVQADWQIRAR